MPLESFTHTAWLSGGMYGIPVLIGQWKRGKSYKIDSRDNILSMRPRQEHKYPMKVLAQPGWAFYLPSGSQKMRWQLPAHSGHDSIAAPVCLLVLYPAEKTSQLNQVQKEGAPGRSVLQVRPHLQLAQHVNITRRVGLPASNWLSLPCPGHLHTPTAFCSQFCATGLKDPQ